MCVWLVWPRGMQDDYNKYGEPTEKEEDIDRGCRSISTLDFVQEVWEKLRISCESKCKKKEICSPKLFEGLAQFGFTKRRVFGDFIAMTVQDLLDLAPCLTPTSRLACQVHE